MALNIDLHQQPPPNLFMVVCRFIPPQQSVPRAAMLLGSLDGTHFLLHYDSHIV